MAPSKDYLCREPDEVEECDIEVLQAELECTKEEVIDLKKENTKLRWQLSKVQEKVEEKTKRCDELEAGRKRLKEGRQKLKAANEHLTATVEDLKTRLASAQAEVATCSQKLKELEADSHKRLEDLERSRKSEELMERELGRFKKNQDELVQKSSKALVVIDQLQEKIRKLEGSLDTQKDAHEGRNSAQSHEHPGEVVPEIACSVNEGQKREDGASSHNPIEDSKAPNPIKEDRQTETSSAPKPSDHTVDTVLADAFTHRLTMLQVSIHRSHFLKESLSH